MVPNAGEAVTLKLKYDPVIASGPFVDALSRTVGDMREHETSRMESALSALVAKGVSLDRVTRYNEERWTEINVDSDLAVNRETNAYATWLVVDGTEVWRGNWIRNGFRFEWSETWKGILADG